MDTSKAEKSRAQTKLEWCWTEYYWYPLAKTVRKDVLAFECQKLENTIKEKEFGLFIEQHFKGRTVNFIQEFIQGSETPVESLEGYGFWHSEVFLVTENLKEIVYWSHEGTITLGGFKLISAFKSSFTNWKHCVCEW